MACTKLLVLVEITFFWTPRSLDSLLVCRDLLPPFFLPLKPFSFMQLQIVVCAAKLLTNHTVASAQ